jgi:lysophospholipase L1-like esterase
MSGDPRRALLRRRRCSSAAPFADKDRRRRWFAFCALALLGALLAAGSAAAARPAGAAHSKPPRRVEIERVGLTAPAGGRSDLLVAIRYPIQLAGQPLELSVSLQQRHEGTVYTWNLGERANAGALRLPDRRRAFTFVHTILLSHEQTRLARRGGARVVVDASGALDIDGDTIAELDSRDHERHGVQSVAASRRLCGSVPQLRTRPGERVFVTLPRCGSAVRWRIADRPDGGDAHIYKGRLVYRSGSHFRGTATLELSARSGSGASADENRSHRHSKSPRTQPEPLSVPVQVQVLTERSEGAIVRAMGDSVTAGFGYYDEGSTMPFGELLNCRPGEGEYDDACSSNSTVRTNRKGTKLEYAPDYGLSNNVSWAAQWANEHSVKNYANFAVSGSEPKDWAPGGKLYATTQRIESEFPDYILMTVGANPLLADVLFGADSMGCAVWSEIVGGFSECVERAFAEVELRANLVRLYRELVARTNAVVYLMQYPLTVPATALAYSSIQIAEMGVLLNREIAAAAAEVSRERLRPVAPPHFNVGIDVSPVYPSQFTCSSLGYKVDGPSVQSDPTQDELEVDHPLSFCEGPGGGAQPWVISGDTGIHPSASGYAQMAAAVPAP